MRTTSDKDALPPPTGAGATTNDFDVVRAGIAIHPDEPTDVVVDLERRALAALDRIKDENERLREALEEIVACDYRGNMPPEQAIARAALGEQP